MAADASRGKVAHWNFRTGPHLIDRLNPERTLRHSEVGSVWWQADNQVGGCMVFAGDGGHLRLPSKEVGDLDMSGTGTVTVMALVRRGALGHGFIAGLWQEQDSDPRRQYGMFIDLPAYGGGDQVIGHVSRTGGASTNLPYSRDYAASARMVRPGDWRVIAFRYDGEHITAFLDGIADPRPEFVEVGPPLGEGLRYAKNPFRFDGGLYAGPLAEFTVGAVLLTSGIGNAFSGALAELAVWDRALRDDELAALTAEWTPDGAAVATFDWWRKEPAPGGTSGGEDGLAWSVESAGARQRAGSSTPVRVLPSRLVRERADDDAVVELPLVPVARRIAVEDVVDPARLHLVVRDGHRRISLATPTQARIWTLPPRSCGTTLEIHLRAGGRLSIGAVRYLT